MENLYELSIPGYPAWNVPAETPGKAKYQEWLELHDVWPDYTFGDFVKECKCRLLRKAQLSDHFIDPECFQRVCESRGIDWAYQGQKVVLRGEEGYIIGGNSSGNFDVLFNNGIGNCHPFWEMVYYGRNGEIVYDSREKREETP